MTNGSALNYREVRHCRGQVRHLLKCTAPDVTLWDRASQTACHRTHRCVAWILTIHNAIYELNTTITTSTPCSIWFRHCATSWKVAASIPDGVIGIFHWQSYRPHYGPGVDPACNRNEYQGYLLGGEGVWCVGLTILPPSCADCLEIWDIDCFYNREGMCLLRGTSCIFKFAQAIKACLHGSPRLINTVESVKLNSTVER